MSHLRLSADASPLEEFHADAELLNGVYPKRKSSSEKSANETRIVLEHQFEAAQQTLASQQKQAFKALQEACVELLESHANSEPTTPYGGTSWSEASMSLPGSLVFDDDMKKPCAPQSFPPHLPEMINAEAQLPTVNGIHTPKATKQNGWLNDLLDSEEEKSTVDEMSATPTVTINDVVESQDALVRASCESQESALPVTKTRTSMVPLRGDMHASQEPSKRNRMTFAQHAVANRRSAKRPSMLQGRFGFNTQDLYSSDTGFTSEGASRDSSRKADKGPAISMARAVFADAAEMKAKVKENIMKPDYNVAKYYKTEGKAQMVARSHLFDNITTTVIGLNALWIWIDTDYNDAATLIDAHPFFQVGENLFSLYFFAEVLIRFAAFKYKSNCIRDAWFVFDSALVAMLVVETWILNLIFWILDLDVGGQMGNASILRLVRLLRLTRMARMVRLLRSMPELMILVKGIAVAARSVFFTLVLLIVILYIFAIAFRQLTADNDLEDSHFKSVPHAMNTLLLQGVIPDQGALVSDVGDFSLLYGFFVMIFILLSSLTVMNMLVGVLCEVISVVSAVEKEQMTLTFVKTKIKSLMQESGIDKDGSCSVSRDEFEALLLLPEGARVIQEVGVDVVVLIDLIDHIFNDDVKELTFPDLMELVLQLRGTNTATVRDVVDLRKFLTQMNEKTNDYLIDCISQLVNEHMDKVVGGKRSRVASQVPDRYTWVPSRPTATPVRSESLRSNSASRRTMAMRMESVIEG